MKLSKEKKSALGILLLASVLHAIGSQYVVGNSNGYYEGSGLIINLFGLIIWFYGMIKYARAKGRSEMLAIVLSLFWWLGLIVLLLLGDVKKTSKS